MVDLSTVSSMVSRSSNETERPACIMVRNTRMPDGSGLYVPFGQLGPNISFLPFFLFNKFLYAYGVHYRNEGDAYVGKDSFPKCSDSTGTEDEDKQLHSEMPARCSARQSGGFACPHEWRSATLEGWSVCITTSAVSMAASLPSPPMAMPT